MADSGASPLVQTVREMVLRDCLLQADIAEHMGARGDAWSLRRAAEHLVKLCDLLESAEEQISQLRPQSVESQRLKRWLMDRATTADKRAELAEAACQRLREAAAFKRNVIMADGAHRGFLGEWIAVPREDFDRLRSVLGEREGT